MKQFKVIVTRTDEYIIEIDESIYNEQWAEDFEKVFWPVSDLEDLAKHIAQIQARFGDHSFLEGFGNVKRNGKPLYPIKEEDTAPGLNIKVVDEDNNIECDVIEINE